MLVKLMWQLHPAHSSCRIIVVLKDGENGTRKTDKQKSRVTTDQVNAWKQYKRWQQITRVSGCSELTEQHTLCRTEAVGVSDFMTPGETGEHYFSPAHSLDTLSSPLKFSLPRGKLPIPTSTSPQSSNPCPSQKLIVLASRCQPTVDGKLFRRQIDAVVVYLWSSPTLRCVLVSIHCYANIYKYVWITNWPTQNLCASIHLAVFWRWDHWQEPEANLSTLSECRKIGSAKAGTRKDTTNARTGKEVAKAGTGKDAAKAGTGKNAAKTGTGNGTTSAKAGTGRTRQRLELRRTRQRLGLGRMRQGWNCKARKRRCKTTQGFVELIW